MKMWLLRIIVALLIGVAFGLWIGVFGALSVFALIVSIFLLAERYQFGRDLNRIVGTFDSRTRGGSRLRPGAVGLWLNLEKLRYRLETLSWESSVLSAQGMSADSVTQNELNCDRDFLMSALNKISEQFRCVNAALIVASGRSTKQRQILSAGALHGRLERQLFRIFGPFFDQGIAQVFGRQECSGPHGLLSTLGTLGFGGSISFPLKWRTGQAVHTGVLWLGYSVQSPPSELEEQRAKSFALKLERELAANERLRELSGRVSVAEGVNREKSDFIAQMSHDIRSPLNNIRSILTLFKLGGFAPDTPDMLQVALNNCDSLGEIVEDILDYSKHSSGKLVAVAEAINLGQVVNTVVEGFSYGARMKGLELVCDLGQDEVIAWCDRRQAKRIICNLVSNAVKYTSHGRVTVKVRPGEGDTINLVVSDTGPGLTDQQVAQLFTPFTRFHGPEIEGVGLGLAVTRILVEMNGGGISVDSVPGQGAAFIVRLAQAQIQPVSATPATSPKSGPALASPNSTLVGTGKTVLVVDDDVDCVDTLAKGMEHLGFRALRAVKVGEAIGITNFEAIDLVLTDATMPEGGGRRLVSYLASSKPNLVVVVVSGRQSSEEQQEFKAIGAAGIFSKPLDFEAFEQWLRELYSSEHDAVLVA